MKHITLILILLFIPFSLFSQGIGCSKEAGSETELETYLSKMIKDTEERKLISKINDTISKNFYNIKKRNEKILKEKHLNYDIEEGFCGPLAIENFHYFQKGGSIKYDLSNTYFKYEGSTLTQGLDEKIIIEFLEKNYVNKDQQIATIELDNPLQYISAIISVRMKEFLVNNGDHGILYIDYNIESSGEKTHKIGHYTNVLRINDTIYYINTSVLTTNLDNILESIGASFQDLNFLGFIYIFNRN